MNLSQVISLSFSLHVFYFNSKSEQWSYEWLIRSFIKENKILIYILIGEINNYATVQSCFTLLLALLISFKAGCFQNIFYQTDTISINFNSAEGWEENQWYFSCPERTSQVPLRDELRKLIYLSQHKMLQDNLRLGNRRNLLRKNDTNLNFKGLLGFIHLERAVGRQFPGEGAAR